MPESSVTSLRRGFKSRQIPEFCSIVIFGATGDLTHRKLVPALYNLFLNNELPKNLRVIGSARRDKTDQQWQEELENSNRENSRSGHDPEAGGNPLLIHGRTCLGARGHAGLRCLGQV